MKVILSPRAELDLEAQVRWLHLHSSSAGRTAALRIVEVIDLLSDFPDIGMVVPAPYARNRFSSAVTAS